MHSKRAYMQLCIAWRITWPLTTAIYRVIHCPSPYMESKSTIVTPALRLVNIIGSWKSIFTLHSICHLSIECIATYTNPYKEYKRITHDPYTWIGKISYLIILGN